MCIIWLVKLCEVLEQVIEVVGKARNSPAKLLNVDVEPVVDARLGIEVAQHKDQIMSTELIHEVEDRLVNPNTFSIRVRRKNMKVDNHKVASPMAEKVNRCTLPLSRIWWKKYSKLL